MPLVGASLPRSFSHAPRLSRAVYRPQRMQPRLSAGAPFMAAIPGRHGSMPAPPPPVRIRSDHSRSVEVGWFAPLCNDDCRYLGVVEPEYTSTPAHAALALLQAEQLGFDNILCPSSYQEGLDAWTFAAMMGPQTRRMSLMPAVRCGEVEPVAMARQISTLQAALDGRLTVNIISSDLYGENLPPEERWGRSAETLDILTRAWSQPRIDHDGKHYTRHLPAAPARGWQSAPPRLYLAGASPDGKRLAAERADVYLLFPETEARLHAQMQDVSRMAAADFGRRLDFGLRLHVVVRDTEEAAQAAALDIISRLPDAQAGRAIVNRAQDAKSAGVLRQAEMRELADADGYIEPQLWTGIGRGRSGCGAALVGSPQQITAKIQRYIDMGFRAFIFSGYPNMEAGRDVARTILPRLEHAPLTSPAAAAVAVKKPAKHGKGYASTSP